MEGLSAAANSIAVVSVAFQLTEACIKLYRFWESVEDAPIEIATIKVDLKYLISVFKRFESNEHLLGQCVSEGLHHCRTQVAGLISIVDRFETGFRSSSRKKRLRTAFKAAIHSDHVQRFRNSLNETKATLTLAMIHESVVQTYDNSSLINARIARPGGMHSHTVKGIGHHVVHKEVQSRWTKETNLAYLDKAFALNALQDLKNSVHEECKPRFHIQQLMLHAIAQTAVANFESSSLDILAHDGYMIDDCGLPRAKTFVYAESLQYRVRHHASNFRTALGQAWVRTTTIYSTNDPVEGISQTVTSFVIYPTAWLKCLGFQRGLEAIVSTAGQSWLFNCRLTVTNALPEDSLIFELCRSGQTRAVETMFHKGLASVVDTSPKGWKPLHFAAAAGHVDLCNMLIRAGADKSALVYEGPSDSILSPISIFVASSTELHAETKIAMLMIFYDCIDLSSPESDGWQVHDWLKRAYAREKVPISQNSITWLLHLTANEQYVECNPRILWSALQHAVRSVLNHERYSRHLERILHLSELESKNIDYQLLNAFGYWLALRVSGRALLPMVTYVGSFLQMRGFDWIEDHMPHSQFLQAQPNLYTAWCHAVLDAVEKIEHYMREELHSCMQTLGWTRSDLLRSLNNIDDGCASREEHNHGFLICSQCGGDHDTGANSLVEPARIAVEECVRTGHDYNCGCEGGLKKIQATLHLPEYTGRCYDRDEEHEPDADEDDFFEAEPYIFENKCDTFSDVATLLYRAQGRTWIGEYAMHERLCATCFLFKEQYIGEDGFAAEFPPMPESFESLRTPI